MPPRLTRSLINRFFKILADDLNLRGSIFLTGAAAGNILGKVRPSNDIDFAVRLVKKDQRSWEKVEKSIRKTMQLTGIHANYSEDIGLWGMISMMDYLKHTIPYQQFGQLEVKVLAPAYWSIGKMTRYLTPDIQDMQNVFKKQKSSYSDLVKIWGLALKNSPKSTALFQFRKNVEDFLASYGKIIWGKSFDVKDAVFRFHKAAGVQESGL